MILPVPPAVRLRPATPADAELLAALVADPRVARTLAAVTPSEPAELRRLVESAAEHPDEEGRLVVEAALDGRPPRAVGSVAWTTRNRRSRIAEVQALVVAPDAWGRGVGEAALRALVADLVHGRGFHRVELEAYGFNGAAHRLFERAGFRREGVRREAPWRHGAWQDGVLYGLVAEERG